MEASFISELSRNYCSYNSSHTICTSLFDRIKKNLDKITNYKDLLESVLAFLSRNSYSYDTTCCSFSNINVLCTLLNLVPLEDLSENSLTLLANSNSYLNDELIKIIKERKKIDGELVNRLVSTRNFKLYCELKSKENIIYKKDDLTYLCFTCRLYENTARNSQLTVSVNINQVINNYILRLLNQNVEVTRESIIGAILTKKPFDIIQQLFTLGPEIKVDYLEAAFFSHHTEVIEFLLDNKIMPNADCMKAIFSSTISNTDNLNISNSMTSYFNVNYGYTSIKPSRPTSTRTYGLPDKYKKIIELLLSSGYKLTYDELTTITKYYITLDSVDKYDIKFDEAFVDLCSNLGFYPKYNKNIRPTINSLRLECDKYGNLPIIRDLITKEKIKPDEQCLENACKFKGNLATVRYLISTCKVPITLKALKNMVHSNANSAASFLVDEFITQENKIIQEKQKLITEVKPVTSKKIIDSDTDFSSSESDTDSEDEKQIVKKSTVITKKIYSSSDSESSSSDSEDEKPVVKPILQPSVKPLKTTKKMIVASKIKKYESSDSESEDEKPIIPKVDPVEITPPVTIKSKKIVVRKKKTDTDDKLIPKKEETPKEQFTELLADISELATLEPAKKVQVMMNYIDVQTKITNLDNIKVPLKTSKYFKLEKDTMLSIVSLKKLLLTQFNNLKLIEKGKFDVILPNDLSTALDYDINKYGKIVSIKTLDKFCSVVLENFQKN